MLKVWIPLAIIFVEKYKVLIGFRAKLAMEGNLVTEKKWCLEFFWTSLQSRGSGSWMNEHLAEKSHCNNWSKMK